MLRYFFCLLFLFFMQFAFAQPYLRRIKSAAETGKDDTTKVKMLLILSREYLIRSGATAKDIDSSIISMKKAESLSHQLLYNAGIGSSMLTAASICNFKGEKDQGFALSKKALLFFIKTNDLPNQGEAYFLIGQHYIGHLDTQLMYYRKAVDVFKRTGHKEREAFVSVEIADYLQINERYQESLKYLIYALAVYKSINYPSLQSVYDLMDRDFVMLNDYTNALKYALLAAKIAESKMYTTLQVCTIYNRVSYCYNALNQFQQADNYAFRALQIAKKFKNNAYIQSVDLDFGLSLCIRNPLKSMFVLREAQKLTKADDKISLQLLEFGYANNYIALTQLQKAAGHLKKLVALSVGENGNRLQERINITLARYNLKLRNNKQAIVYLKKLEKLCFTDRTSYYMLQNQFLWFEADSCASNYVSAIQHYQRYKFLTDSFYNISKAQLTKGLEIEYDIDKKDKAIQFKSKSIELLTKQSQLEQTEAKNTLFTRNVTIAASVILLLLLAIGYNRYRHQQLNNLLLQNQRKEIDQQNREINDQYLSLQNLNQTQQNLLNEKEWLLREIHHRVKNNLQTTISLLNIQSANIFNKKALNAIKDSQRRINAMSLIHQRLYHSENIALINMNIYINELLVYLEESFINPENISLKISTCDIYLDVAFALPVGLIINEAITNIFKYAFPERRKGKITVSMKEDADGHIELSIADNGIGFAPLDENDKTTSLGMKLMKGLTDQINGSFTLKNDLGTKIIIRFQNVSIYT
jgi:two-component sensor histidine kinase